MATATKQSETVETIKSVTLKLSIEEARTLAVILAKVGGRVDRSPRGHATDVFIALEDLGIEYANTPEWKLIDVKLGSGFEFRDYPKADNYPF